VESGSDDTGSAYHVAKTGEFRYGHTIDGSPSPTISVISSDSPPATAAKNAHVSKPPSATTFLPSLMGGYWSGSESEEDDEAAAAASPPLRKNRMGQQARRQLWEKKYGVNANHLKKQDKNYVQGRDKGWDSRRGAIPGDESRRKGDRSKCFSSSTNFERHDGTRQTEHGITPGTKIFGGKASTSAQTHEQKPLHPSWEAARKAKLQKSQATFQGKKVIFN